MKKPEISPQPNSHELVDTTRAGFAVRALHAVGQYVQMFRREGVPGSRGEINDDIGRLQQEIDALRQRAETIQTGLTSSDRVPDPNDLDLETISMTIDFKQRRIDELLARL